MYDHWPGLSYFSNFCFMISDDKTREMLIRWRWPPINILAIIDIALALFTLLLFEQVIDTVYNQYHYRVWTPQSAQYHCELTRLPLTTITGDVLSSWLAVTTTATNSTIVGWRQLDKTAKYICADCAWRPRSVVALYIAYRLDDIEHWWLAPDRRSK